MKKEVSKHLAHPLAHVDAESLRIKVTLILLLLLIGASVAFTLSYVVSGQFALIPYIVIPFLLPASLFYFHLRKHQRYRTILWFLVYFYSTLALLKLTASPTYLVDLFLIPTYIGICFLILKYKHAVPMVVYMLSVYAAAAAIVHWFHPFAVIYTNDNTSSLVVGFIISVVGSTVMCYGFAKNYQHNSERLSDTLYTLSKVNDDNKLLINVVSHDFRNYLTRLVLLIGTYKSRTEDTAYHEELDNLESAIYQLSGLISDMQVVRELSQDKSRHTTAVVAFAQIMKKTDLIFRHQMYEKQLQFNMDRVQPLQLDVNADIFIHIILSNLIGNAIKFSPLRSQIVLGLEEKQGQVQLTIANRAAAEHMANLQKIAKGEDIRASMPGTRMEQGQGLGITILRKFCKLYGIDYSLSVAMLPGEHSCLVTSTLTFS